MIGMNTKHLKILQRVSEITTLPLEKLEEEYYKLNHKDKRGVIHDLRVVLKNYRGSPKDVSELKKMLNV